MLDNDQILRIEDLSVDFDTKHGLVHAVRGVSFEIGAGETLAVLGESGSGKSVSASTILDLIDMPPGRIASGRIHYRGRDILAMSADERRYLAGRKIAMVFQDPLAALNPVYTVGWQIEEVFRLHPSLGVADPRQEAIRLLSRVGIPEPETRIDYYPHQFSGGQRQRVVIAMAIAGRPDLLIADEPTTALDVTIQAEILKLLRSLQKEQGMALLMITHDLGVVADVADRVVVMQNGVIVEKGERDQILHDPKHPYTRHLLDSVPGRHGFVPESVPDSAPALLSVVHASKRYGGFKALDDVSITLKQGETLGIVGESGSGKSTLMRLILELEKPTEGVIEFEGKAIAGMDRRERARLNREIQVVFQDPSASLNPYMTIEEIISEPWAIHRDALPKSQWKETVAKLLVQVGLSPQHARRYPHQFSGGQRQRIAIARAIALKPKLLVCDEALSALDVSIQAQVLRLLKTLRSELGLSFVFVAHDLLIVRDFCHRVAVMKSGSIIEQGDTHEVFTKPQHEYTKTLLEANSFARLLEPVA
ncbi:ABC transporter ATP-binding protein [Ensifer sp. SSB1]|uniref:ABC transporter ATP-binding protein n=1 Tax=Ensifer sp. SSB1 TaxID=2795385 RepID=UPI001A4BD850|nr:ABC transporter ATP-binding protein [Ensifer sp. SSB1]MBK5570620.1 ABC transporter ATP-binding protein [Ensifer sp. SSB1]